MKSERGPASSSEVWVKPGRPALNFPLQKRRSSLLSKVKVWIYWFAGSAVITIVSVTLPFIHIFLFYSFSSSLFYRVFFNWEHYDWTRFTVTKRTELICLYKNEFKIRLKIHIRVSGAAAPAGGAVLLSIKSGFRLSPWTDITDETGSKTPRKTASVYSQEKQQIFSFCCCGNVDI